MPRRTAIASACGLIGGIALSIEISGDPPDTPGTDIVIPVVARVAPSICLLLIALRVLRGWVEESTTQIVKEVSSYKGRSTSAEKAVQRLLDERRAMQKEFNELVDDYNAMVMDALNRARDLAARPEGSEAPPGQDEHVRQ